MDMLVKTAEKILALARARGADSVQCYVSESEKREFNVDGGSFSLMRTLFDRGVAVTVLKNNCKGSIHINRFDDSAISEAVSQCIASCESALPDPAWQFADGPVDESYVDGEPECDTDALFERTRELMQDISQRHPLILVEQMITEHDCERCVYMNSNGVTYRTVTGLYCFDLMYSAHRGEKSSSFYGSGLILKSLDRPIIECALLERDLSDIEKQIDTEPLRGKFVGPVILAPGVLQELVLSTAIGNFLSDISLIDGTSIWKDSLGSLVADGTFSLSVTPRSEDMIVGQRYTGEGYPAEDYEIIKNGRLVSFALSQYGANKTGGKRAGTDSTELTVAPGSPCLDEIIRGIERGVLVMRFSGGSPSTGGDFSGVAKNSFLIENGRIKCALSETMISGCVADMLKNIRAVSSDVLKDGSVSLPYIAFDGLTVSGK
ncbi:MAG: TldD/PmbA family protein [Oscillospiraceae bacterium]|nr:TldD/PmbA family protein [Oscillospiraceae bacterium]